MEEVGQWPSKRPYGGTLSVVCRVGGTGSRNCHLIEIGASPSQERKSTWPQ